MPASQAQELGKRVCYLSGPGLTARVMQNLPGADSPRHCIMKEMFLTKVGRSRLLPFFHDSRRKIWSG
jgi:hypothetical protein